MIYGTSKKTPWMSDQFLQLTIQVSGGKNMATGLVIPVKPAKIQPGGPEKSQGHRLTESKAKRQRLETIWLKTGTGGDAMTSCFGDFKWVNLLNNQTGPDLELKTTLQINFHPYLSGLLEITHQPLQCRHSRPYFVFLLHYRVCLLILAVLLPLEARPVWVSIESQHQLDWGPEYTNATAQGAERGARQVWGPPGKYLRLLSV